MKRIYTFFGARTDKPLVWALVAGVSFLTSSGLQSASAGSRRIEWLERPWELRYILYVSDDWASDIRSAKKWETKANPTDLDRYSWELFFEPQTFFPSKSKWALAGEGLSGLVIEFDKNGSVKTPNSYGAKLYGRIDRLMYITLSPGNYAKQPRYDLGEWFMGLGDVSTHWAPGLCDAQSMPNPFAKTDTGYLYGPVFTPSPSLRTFGCREWAYQLGDPNRPYIDITSYFRKKDDPDGSGTYVRVTKGWSRFNDKPKPVIGKHEEDWYCFHDCPGSDKPGLIPDINAWAKKNGWAAPKRPTRMPVFPDPPTKQGTYP